MALNQIVEPALVIPESIKLYGVPKISSDTIKPYFEIYSVKDGRLMHSSLDPEKKNLKKFDINLYNQKNSPPVEIPILGGPLLIGDILVKAYHSGRAISFELTKKPQLVASSCSDMHSILGS